MASATSLLKSLTPDERLLTASLPTTILFPKTPFLSLFSKPNSSISLSMKKKLNLQRNTVPLVAQSSDWARQQNAIQDVSEEGEEGEVILADVRKEQSSRIKQRDTSGKLTRYWNINLEEMMKSGVHFGHGTKKWNPKMAPYIASNRNGIHIINLTKTARLLSEGCDLLFNAASQGKTFLIVGTKNKASDLVASAAIRARCHYVNTKWLGGMLTNWSTTETRLQRFRDLRADQKMGKLSRLPKREASMLKRKLVTLQKYLGGVKYMTKLPDIVIIVDQQEEYTAIRECAILGIPTICLIDTNCDPELADISIPANDDAIASIRLILNKLVSAICEGRASAVKSR